MDDDKKGAEPGRRKDGRHYAPDNTRDDGSYAVGKNRTPAATRFSVDDGRPRGRRPKGVRNLTTDWREVLSERISVNVNGKKTKHSKQRVVVISTVDRAMKGNDRATEIALRYAVSTEQTPDRMPTSDLEIIDAFLRDFAAQPAGTVSDDHDDPSAGDTGEEAGDGSSR